MNARAVLLLAAVCPAAAQAQTVDLRLGGRQGQSNHYQMTFDMFVRGGPMAAMMSSDTTLPMTRITTFSTRTLTGIRGDTLEFTEVIDSARFESPAMPQMAQMAGPQVTAMMIGTSTISRMNSRGEVYSMDTRLGPGAQGMGGAGSRMSGPGTPPAMFGLPERPVRVGETWTDADTVTVENVTTMTQGTYRLERVASEGGNRTAVVSVSGSMKSETPGGPMNMTTSGEIQLDLANQRLSSMTMTMNGVMNNPQMGGEMPMRMVMAQRLVR